MEGRSGGTMIAVGKEWIIKECNPKVELGLEADDECYCMAHVGSTHGPEEFLAICYYGHPAKRTMTLRDLGRMDHFVGATALPVVLMGDFNITADAEEMGLHSLKDAADIWAQRTGGEVPMTYEGLGQANKSGPYMAGWLHVTENGGLQYT